ncbi:MAG: hypothetical protein ABIR30_07090 [Chitinophagaceae bacterium]
MLLLTIEVTDQHAMKTLHLLQEKNFIKIADDADLSSPSLPGTPLTLKAFKNWVENAGKNDTTSLKQAKIKWADKRKQLLRISR